MFRLIKAVVPAAACWWVQAALADQESAAPASAGALLGTGELLRWLLTVVVLLLLLVLAGVVFKRSRRFKAGGHFQVRVLATVPLGPKEKLLLIEVEGRRLLLGSGSGGLSLIYDLTKEPAAQAPVPASGRGSGRESAAPAVIAGPAAQEQGTAADDEKGADPELHLDAESFAALLQRAPARQNRVLPEIVQLADAGGQAGEQSDSRTPAAGGQNQPFHSLLRRRR